MIHNGLAELVVKVVPKRDCCDLVPHADPLSDGILGLLDFFSCSFGQVEAELVTTFNSLDS